MRKKIAIFLFILVFAVALSGCTVLPASEETGIGPKEYADIRNTEATKKENESLKKERDNLKTEMEKMEKDYLELAKNNETVISKLEEAETKLDILEGEGIPDFYSEKTDQNSISAYLSSNKDVLEKDIRGIEIIDNPNDGYILFYTTGYGDNLNQLFIWNTGENEPVLINGATFDKNGSLKRINDRYLLIDAGEGEYKITDAKSMKITSVFYSMQDAYLISETATYIIQKPDTGIFVLYDFISLKEQEIDLDYKNKYIYFKEDKTKNEFIFTGNYYDEYGTTYFVQAVINIEKMKEKYGIFTLEEAIEKTGNNTEEMESIESIEQIENEGTV